MVYKSNIGLLDAYCANNQAHNINANEQVKQLKVVNCTVKVAFPLLEQHIPLGIFWKLLAGRNQQYGLR